MAKESLTSPEAMKCSHRWKKVEGALGSNGELVVLCEKCSTTRFVTQPVKEASKDERPLLLEGS